VYMNGQSGVKTILIGRGIGRIHQQHRVLENLEKFMTNSKSLIQGGMMSFTRRQKRLVPE